MPKLYFSMTAEAPAEFEVVDGQQRIATIFEFFGGFLPLNAESAELFGGFLYSELPEVMSDHFDDFEIEYDEITDAGDEELQQFFQRLQEGMSLTAAEKLNSVRGNLTKFCRQLAGHVFFSENVAIKDTRKAYFDIVAKAAAVEVDGIEVGLRYNDLKILFESQKSFSSKSNVAKRLIDALDYLSGVFDVPSKALRNRSTIQSIVTLGALIADSGKSAGTESALKQFIDHFTVELAKQVELGQNATDIDYLTFQRTLSANVKVGPKTRHEILLRKLLVFDSAWAETLGGAVLVSAGIEADIARLGESVASLVTMTNEEYSSKSGADLFKPTNKTVAALKDLREPVKDFASYSKFVDDLYFLFREGPGQRLDGDLPESFVDINLLRTGLQHDVDHGKGSASKRRQIGESFKRYAAGATAPATLAPERFPLVQVALLSAIERDLRSLRF